jgi:TrmH family RNA methyltransferase
MISSVHNPRVQAVRRLQARAKERHTTQSFVVEGVRLVEEAWLASWTAKQVYYSEALDERGRAVVEGLSGQGSEVEEVSQAVMNAMSETETPQGLLAVLAQQTLPLPSAARFLLILDGLRDPGNLGTILRTARAAGTEGVLLAPGCVDAWSGKVLRAGMGAHFRLPILTPNWKEINSLLEQAPRRLKVYLAAASQGRPYTEADFKAPMALIVGGEASGAGEEALSITDEQVHIPMPGESESLNAAVAAGILLFEVVRQRGG